MTDLTLDVAIATHRKEGIARVASMVMPPVPGVRYVVSWQNHGGLPIPRELMRDDIIVSRYDSVGLSRNRNNALSHCSADIVLIADDDVILADGCFATVRNAFASYPDTDVMLFKAHRQVPKTYPPESCRISLPLPKGYYMSTYEIAFRRKCFPALGFHALLGPGNSRYACGEDEYFVISAIRQGLECRFFNSYICSHPHLSTGDKEPTPGVLRSYGLLITTVYPFTALLRLPLKAWRLSRAGGVSFPGALRHLLSGALGAPRFR